MPATARRHVRSTSRPAARPQLYPTIFLERGDQLAVRDALDALPDEVEARERLIDSIDMLDALGAEALNVLHLPPDELRLAAEADLQACTVWLTAALYEAMRRTSAADPPH